MLCEIVWEAHFIHNQRQKVWHGTAGVEREVFCRDDKRRKGWGASA